MKPVFSKGQIIRWIDNRGFGFIQPSDGSKEVFIHISAFKNVNHRPQVGDLIQYELVVDKNGKLSACKASIQGGTPTPIVNSSYSRKPTKSKTKLLKRLVKKFSPLVFKTLLLSLLPVLGSIFLLIKASNPIPLLIYLLMSLITFALYADDKSRAKQGKWRVSENTLHICETAGGWLGGFVAQQILRHKTSKVSYQVVFWLIAGVHIVFWLYWLLNMTM
ncbi:cold shock and DUF1294 domain-containing protein [Calothrix sp. FACHB-1219]|uniref:DUF1294 domain-containing protein n=1 Tax=unclassified Calothrix TaxID=2619626 RepID=UPI001682F3C4|nr:MULTISPECIES: cold shock and DUF1294 domain-containing protein [unclassified Calothrix]MBD2202814.1 cold shock and DUF1294 domain-containing protein [Calothrix sp. FACHB-168]MBD2218967.1 cold shock and DUF1294 domain-containing protein [Calothrix sp. FACHB-1219]